MRLPAIRGVIDRRILANYRIDPEVMARVLPAPFRPLEVGGFAIGGICLIRLVAIRPRFVPIPWGLRSENAAHRIAVEWEAEGRTRQGVFIPRRDTDSWLVTWTGGRIFPGVHHHARFAVEETDQRVSVALDSSDDETHVRVVGRVSDRLPEGSVFGSVESASRFFEDGSLGYSPTRRPGHYDGLELRCQNWRVEALEVSDVASSFLEDRTRFPKGSVTFDDALLMRGIHHEWHGREDLCCPQPERAS